MHVSKKLCVCPTFIFSMFVWLCKLKSLFEYPAQFVKKQCDEIGKNKVSVP